MVSHVLIVIIPGTINIHARMFQSFSWKLLHVYRHAHNIYYVYEKSLSKLFILIKDQECCRIANWLSNVFLDENYAYASLILKTKLWCLRNSPTNNPFHFRQRFAHEMSHISCAA